MIIGNSQFVDNDAATLYADMWVYDGTVIGTNLFFSKSNELIDHIGANDGTTLSCGPDCGVAKYGNCSLNILDLCYANCEDECYDCPAGTASDEVKLSGVESCINCAPGFVSEAGSTECEICEVGKYATNGTTVVNGLSLAGASFCAECEAGYYQPVEGGLQCVLCESGSSSSGGATSCVECEAGSYAPANGASCLECAAGTYSASSGADSCASCCEYETSTRGATSCVLAVPGYYYQPSTHTLTVCPINAECDGAQNFPRPKQGHWVDRRLAKYADVMRRCSRSTCKGGARKDIVNGTSCWSSWHFNETWFNSLSNSSAIHDCDTDSIQCTEGASGALCGSCDSGYVYSASDASCVACGEFWLSGTIVTVIVICLAGLIYYQSKQLDLSTYSLFQFFGHFDGGSLKVLWVTYQIIASATSSLDIKFLVSIAFRSCATDCICGDDVRFYLFELFC
jgi:syndecan 4